MENTIRSKARAVRVLAAISMFLSAALPPSAAAQFVAAAYQPQAGFFAPRPLVELGAHGRELQVHLAGGRPARLEFISGRVAELKRRVAAGLPAADEPERVVSELERVSSLLDRALGRFAAASPRWVASAPANPAGPAVAKTLNGAAAAPRNPSLYFDGMNAAPRAAAAPAFGFRPGSAPAAGGSSRPALPAGYGSDLNIRVPAPYAAASAAPAAVPAAAPARMERVSALVARLVGADGKVLSYEAGAAALLAERDPAARGALALRIARELLSALRKPGEESALELGAFLRDIAEYRPAGATGARLSADGQNHFRLIFDRADGSRRVVEGQFLPGTARNGRPAGTAFIVMGAIEIDAAGRARQDNPGYWREYGADGGRLDWSTEKETEEKGWGPWKHRNELASSWTTAKVWRDGAWATTGREKRKSGVAKEGLSWFGRAEEKIMKTPVVGAALKGCDQVATGIYTAVVGAPQIILAGAMKSDMYSLEAGGSYAKNPLVNALIDDQGHLDRLTPGARRELASKVAEVRRRALDASLIPLAPEARAAALEAPVSAKESVTVLKDNYGASTYGKRMIAESAHMDGWKGAAMKAGGVATGAFENVAEGVCNPILWATLGAGEAVAALKGSAAVANGVVGAKAALTAVRVVEAGATVAWWAPWLLSGTDNLGKVAQLTTEGKFDKAYFEKLGTAGADFLYMFVVP